MSTSVSYSIFILTLHFFHGKVVSNFIVKLSLPEDVTIYVVASDPSKPGPQFEDQEQGSAVGAVALAPKFPGTVTLTFVMCHKGKIVFYL